MAMFISLTKMLGKGKIHFGTGFRITKKNAAWIWFILLFYYIFVAMWYIILICVWMVYAVCYGFYALIRWIIQKVKGNR